VRLIRGAKGDYGTIIHRTTLSLGQAKLWLPCKKEISLSSQSELMTFEKLNLFALTLLVGSFLVLLGGCSPGGPKTYKMQGRVVTETGKPIEMGSVEFRSEGNQSRVIARGKIKPDGSFSLSTFAIDDGAVAGMHHVIVQQMIIAEGFGKSHEHGPRVPVVYSDYASSGLTAEVKKIEDNFVTLMVQISP